MSPKFKPKWVVLSPSHPHGTANMIVGVSNNQQLSIWRVLRGLIVGIGVAICLFGPKIVPGISEQSSVYRYEIFAAGATFIVIGLLLTRLANRGRKS